MPQTNKQGEEVIPTPLTSGTLDQPNAPQSSVSANNPTGAITGNTDDLFPLLSKSPGFKEAMAKADQTGSPDAATTLPPAMIMNRNLNILENSDLYKNATPRNRVLMQQAFYKKYVVPAQQAAKYKGSFDEWIKDRGTYWQYKVNPASKDKPLGGFVPGLSSKKATSEGVSALAGGLARKNLDIAKTLDDERRAAMWHFKNISKEFSFGTAMLNAEIAPHMGPITMDPQYRGVRKDGTTEQIRQLIKDDDYFALNGYQQTVANKIMRKTGEFTGDLPLFFATDGLAGLSAEALGVAETAKAIDVAKVLPMTGLQRIGAKSIGYAAQGYLVGILEGDKEPGKTAAAFGATSLALGLGGWQVSEGLISPAAKYFGKIFGWGGGKLAGGLINQATGAVNNKAPQAVVSPVSTALAGSGKQKISAAVISALNHLTNGNFYKAPEAARKEALAKLALVAPEYAQQIAYIDKTAIGADAAQTLVVQREGVPEYNEFLTKLEQASKKQTHETVAEAAKDNSQAQLMRRSTDRWVQEMFKDPTIRADIEKDLAKYTGVERRQSLPSDITRPGAAYINSLEFGDNLTKHVDSRLEAHGLGKDRLQFETRADKWLFYLNMMQAELAHDGPSIEKEREFQILLSKLNEEFPGDKGSLPNLLKMSDKIWGDMEQATSAGLFREGELFKYWRQHSRPGESPFAHEVELLQQAQKAESEATKAIPSAEEQDRMLKEAFAKTESAKPGSKDTAKLQAATEKLFPGRTFNELSGKERIQAVNESLGKGVKKSEKSGPGAASIKDPAFVGKKMGSFADRMNKIPPTFTAQHFSDYLDPNARQTMLENPKKITEELLDLYKTDSIFKDFADAARQYVHNNATIADAARAVTGMKPKATFSNWIGQLDEHQAFVSRTKYIDGSYMSGPPTADPKGTIMTMRQAQKYAENLYTAIREADETATRKYRGMSFNSNYKTDVELYQKFEDLKHGDTIDLPLTSFSRSERIANYFAKFNEPGHYNVLVSLEGPHKGINISPFNHFGEEEFLTGGQFKVLHVTRSRGDMVIVLHQTGIF